MEDEKDEVRDADKPAVTHETLPDRIVAPHGTDLLVESVGVLSEVEGSEGTKFDMVVIRAGMSKNRVHYAADMLERSLPLLEGRPMYIDHSADLTRSIASKVGWWENARMGEIDGTPAILATLNVFKAANSPHPWFPGMVKEALERGNPKVVGVSIVAAGKTELAKDEFGVYKNVKEIAFYASADAVAEPGAGGQPLSLVASEGKDKDVMDIESLTKEKLKELRPDLFETDSSDKPETKDEEKKEDKMAESAPQKVEVKIEGLDAFKENLDEWKKLDTQRALAEALRDVNLPEETKNLIRAEADDKILTREEVKALIDRYVKVAESFVRPDTMQNRGMAGLIVPFGNVETGLDAVERVQLAMDDFFGNDVPADKQGKFPKIRSLREFYVGFTGDVTISGTPDPSQSWFREALPTAAKLIGSPPQSGGVTFTNLFGTAINRALMKQYAGQPRWWEPIVSKTDLRDMKTQTRVQTNAFGSLTERTEDGVEYTELAWGETAETYSPTEYGNLVTVGRRAMINDDMNGIRRIPSELAKAANRTLNEYVSNLFTQGSGDGPTMSDTYRVFDATNHQSNRATAALSRSALIDGIKVLGKMQDSASKRVGFKAETLLIPIDLVDTAFELLRTNQVPESANNALNFVNSPLGVRNMIVVPQWTDANNWYLMAAPSEIVCIELGFLFGRETPELLQKPLSNDGLGWTNDVASFKVRWDFGGDWIDYRGAYGSIVA